MTGGSRSNKLILDLDSSVSETYGRQEGTAYNGHVECSSYLPLVLYNQIGDLERAPEDASKKGGGIAGGNAE